MNNTTGHAHDATAWLQLARRLQKQQLQQFSQLGELASQLSALVHMLQCERGASNIYLCSGGLLYTAECRAGGAALLGGTVHQRNKRERSRVLQRLRDALRFLSE